jgi:C-terminal processing protease CtpA/Prc
VSRTPFFEVFDVVAGGPAAKAGIKAGDHILAVDGESVESLDLPSLRMEIANKVSRKQLRLKMNSEGTLRNVTVMPRDLL